MKKNSEKIKVFFEKIKKCPPSGVVILLLFVGMYFKNLLLQFYIAGANYYVPDLTEGIPAVMKGLFLSFVTLILLSSFLLLFQKAKGRVIYMVVVSLIFTAMAIVDVCYYRVSPEMPSLILLSLSGDAAGAGHLNLQAVIDTFSVYDILFFADYILIGLFFAGRYFYRKKSGQSSKIPEKTVPAKTRLLRFAAVICPCVLILLALPFCNLLGIFKESYRAVYTPAYSKDTALYFTPLGYHLTDAVAILDETIEKENPSPKPSEKNDELLQQVEDFYEYNEENLPNNEFFAMYQDKNLLFIQIESLETVVLGASVGGVEITPNLNQLISKNSASIYFPHIYEQVKSGNSSDCDLMINSSVLPTSRLFFRSYSDKDLPSMPEILRDYGYETYYFNGSGSKSVWPYEEVYKNVFGYDTDPNSSDCNFMMLDAETDEDLIYRYLSDEKTFEGALAVLTEKLEAGDRFFSHIVLCSSHTPFLSAPEEDKLFSSMYPKDADSKTLGYFDSLHYVDRQIGIFLENAEAAGLLEDTVVVLYGDHAGIHKYFPQDADAMHEKYEELSFIGADQYSTVPLILYDPSGETEHVECNTIGGQIDIMPTMMYLLGVERAEYSFAMGKNLLNTKRNYTVLSNGTIIGACDEDSRAYEIVYRMYNTADLIVKEDYFGRSGKSEDEK